MTSMCGRRRSGWRSCGICIVETRAGGVARAVAVEQLSILSVGGGRTRACEYGLDGDFVSGSGGVALLLQAVRYPPLRTEREGTGHPLSWWCTRRSKAGPPAARGDLLGLNFNRFGKGQRTAHLVADFNRPSPLQVSGDHTGLRPIEIPAVLDCQQRIRTRNYIR